MFFDLVASTKIAAKLLLLLHIRKKSCTFAVIFMYFSHPQYTTT